MKKILLMTFALLLCMSTASATILPADGVDEDFKAWKRPLQWCCANPSAS